MRKRSQEPEPPRSGKAVCARREEEEEGWETSSPVLPESSAVESAEPGALRSTEGARVSKEPKSVRA